jgi:hypothetical protein
MAKYVDIVVKNILGKPIKLCLGKFKEVGMHGRPFDPTLSFDEQLFIAIKKYSNGDKYTVD